MTLTRNQIAKKIAGEIGCTQKKASAILSALLDTIKTELGEKGSVSIRKLGKFYITTRNPRVIIHPITGQRLKVGKRNIIRFKGSKYLDMALNVLEWTGADPHNQEILQALYELTEDSEIEDLDEDDTMYYPGKNKGS